MRVAVVIPTKDREPLLARALGSVMPQLPANARLVVINDGSLDGTARLLSDISDTRVSVISHTLPLGVNISRNEGIGSLPPDCWAILLDDDDELIRGIMPNIEQTLAEVPEDVGVVFFNTRIETTNGAFTGGYQFPEGSHGTWHQPSYEEVLGKVNLRGDCKPVVRTSLFGRFRFSEDVNGFESEFYSLLAKKGVLFRYYRTEIMRVDQAHGMERLSDTAAARDPHSFVRVHRRMMEEHAAALRTLPELMHRRAVAGLKIALRAGDVSATMYFAWMATVSYLKRLMSYRSGDTFANE